MLRPVPGLPGLARVAGCPFSLTKEPWNRLCMNGEIDCSRAERGTCGFVLTSCFSTWACQAFPRRRRPRIKSPCDHSYSPPHRTDPQSLQSVELPDWEGKGRRRKKRARGDLAAGHVKSDPSRLGNHQQRRDRPFSSDWGFRGGSWLSRKESGSIQSLRAPPEPPTPPPPSVDIRPEARCVAHGPAGWCPRPPGLDRPGGSSRFSRRRDGDFFLKGRKPKPHLKTTGRGRRDGAEAPPRLAPQPCRPPRSAAVSSPLLGVSRLLSAQRSAPFRAPRAARGGERRVASTRCLRSEPSTGLRSEGAAVALSTGGGGGGEALQGLLPPGVNA